MRKLFHIAFSVGLTALLCYLIGRQVPDWRKSLSVMMEAKPAWILAALCFMMLHMVLRAWRWGTLLSAAKRGVSLKNLLSLTFVKYVVNLIPPRSGEIAASIILAKKEKIAVATVIAASVFERILDAVTVMVIAVFYVMFAATHFPPNSERGREILARIQNYSIKGFIVFAAATLVLILLLRRRHWSSRLPPAIGEHAGHFLEGFRALQSGGAAFQTILLSVAIWFVISMQTWCIVQAYLSPFPFLGSVLLVILTVVGVAIPTPGGFGGYQYFMSLGLVTFLGEFLSRQDPHSQAAGISNGAFFLSTLPVLITGLILLNKEGLSFGRMMSMKEQAQENSSIDDQIR
jgi:uncharacterized protein (TIRG00374 family)